LRSPLTNIWDRQAGCVHFWDGRTLPGEVQVSGNAWIYRPARPLSSGADLLIALPLRSLQVVRIPTPGLSPRWHIDVVGTGTHASGGLTVSDWYIDVVVEAGRYKVENLGEFAEAVQQRLLTDAQMMHGIRALELACEGLNRSDFSVPALLELWDASLA
jgi:hypothetical protein